MDVGKKKYEKPAMRVCELKHRCRLLTGSEVETRGRKAQMDVTYGEEDI